MTKMMSEDTPSGKVLTRLRMLGWQQGSLGRYLGKSCLRGAAAFCGGFEQDLDDRWSKIIEEQFPERLPPSGEHRESSHVVVHFNDHRNTIFDDVQLVLEKAIAEEQEQVES